MIHCADLPLTTLPPVRRELVRFERPTQVGYWIGMLAAVGIHAGILFGFPASEGVTEQVEFGVEVADASVDVTLIAAMPAEPVVDVSEPEVEPEVIEPEVMPPEPEPEPVPVAEAEPEVALPEPEPIPMPEPKIVEAPKPKPQVTPPKPKVPRVKRPVGDGSSRVPGTDATSSIAKSGATSTKPGYLRNPQPAYPAQSLAAGHQGVVQLIVKVSETGHVIQARLKRTSGYSLLDERALSTVRERWLFKPARVDGVPVVSDVGVPIRFKLGQ